MTHFVLTCLDRKDGLEARLATRQAHLDYCGANAAIMSLAGPLLDDDGQMIGSLIILEGDKPQAEAFAAGDPYQQAGVFESVVIREFKITRGEIK